MTSMALVAAHRAQQALLGQGVAGSGPKDWADILRHDVAPVASAYVLVLVLLVAYRRSRRGGSVSRPVALRDEPAGKTAPVAPTVVDLVRHVATTVLGGYAVFLMIVAVFYFALGGESPTFIEQALREGSVLAFLIVLPALCLFGWIEGRRIHRRRG